MKRTGTRKGVTALAALVVLACGLPAGAGAQVAWDSPIMLHPYAPWGWSFYLADPHPGNDVAVAAQWRTAAMPVGVGVRLGLGEGTDDDLAVFGGVDLTDRLITYSDELPLDLIWLFGAGLSVSDAVLLSVPAGLVAGWDLVVEGVSFRPYVGPRVVLDAWLGGRDEGEGDDELDLSATVDLGVDVAFSGGWVARFGASVGDRDAVAVGLAIPAIGR